MRKIEAIIREEKMEEVTQALIKSGVTGITVYQVMGCGTQRGCTSVVRGRKVYSQILPKIKLEIIVSSKEWEDKVVDVLLNTARTGYYGDGKIFIQALDAAIRIRTGERDYAAVNTSTETVDEQ